MEPVKLTEEEYADLLDINRAAEAATHTFKVAMQHHTEQQQQIEASNRDWWNAVTAARPDQLDPKTRLYINHDDQTVCLYEDESPPKEN